MGKAQDHERRSPSGIREALVVGCTDTQGRGVNEREALRKFYARGLERRAYLSTTALTICQKEPPVKAFGSALRFERESLL